MTPHLFTGVTSRELGMLRSTVFGIWVVILWFSPFTNYAALPPALFEPLGIYRLLLGSGEGPIMQIILTEGFLFSLKWVLLVGCILCMIGTKPFKWIAVPTVLLLFLADAITKGFNGFVNHAELGVLYASLILAIFPSADEFSVFKNSFTTQKNHAYYVIPVLTIAVVLCMAYTFIGTHRLLHGGMEQFFNHAMNVHILVNTLNYSKYGFDLGLMGAASPALMILFKTGFFAITMFEVTSLFTLVNRPFRYIWMSVMIPFHLLSLLTMNIFFWENVVLIIVLFGIIGERNHKTGVRKGVV